MSRTTRLVMTTAASGALAALSFALPGAATAAPYPAKASTTTTVTLKKTVVKRGHANSASVSVTSDAGTPSGTLTFQIPGVGRYTERLVDGHASHAIPTDLKPGTYTVHVRYNGSTGKPAGAAPAGGYKPSSDTVFYTVQSGRGSVAGVGQGRGGVSGTVDAAAGGLGGTGVAGSTELLALVGFGLVGAGAAGVMVARRRTSNA